MFNIIAYNIPIHRCEKRRPRINMLLITILTIFLAGVYHPVTAQGFESETLIENVPSVWGIAGGDFDGDGDIDFATASKSGNNPDFVNWFEMRVGEPPLQHLITEIGGDGGRYLTASDLDNDEDVDLVLAAYGDNRFIEFENTGTPGPDRFLELTLDPSAHGAWQAVEADFDGDQLPDLITCSIGSDAVRILLQSNGVFLQILNTTIVDPMGAFPVDYDGDQDLDILVCSSSLGQAGGVYLIEQIESQQFETRQLVDSIRLTSIAAADFDEDQDVDLVAAAFVEDRVIWWEQRPNGLFDHDLSGSFDGPRSVAIADFDEDGRMDVVAVSEGPSFGWQVVRWWRNEIGTDFTGENLWEGDRPSGLAIVDFDRDGDPDILTSLTAIGEIKLFRNELGTPAIIVGAVTALTSAQPISDVRVTVLETGTTGFTDSLGHYTLETGEGVFTVAAMHRCWNDAQIGGVNGEPGQVTIVDFSLRQPELLIESSSLNLIAPNRELTVGDLPVTNTGNGEMLVTTEIFGNFVDDEWLSILPDSTTIAAGETQNFEVRIEPDTSDSGVWDYAGEIVFHTDACPDTVVHVAVIVHVLDAPDRAGPLPLTTELYPPYPNPFNSSAAVNYSIETRSSVNIALYDLTGRHIQSLVSGSLQPGTHAVIIDGSDLASGTYFIRMLTGDRVYSRTITLLK